MLRLLEAAPGPQTQGSAHCDLRAGLRAMEVVALKVSNIDPKRMMLRVERDKGRSDPLQLRHHAGSLAPQR